MHMRCLQQGLEILWDPSGMTLVTCTPATVVGKLCNPASMPAVRAAQIACASSDEISGHLSPASTADCSAGGTAVAAPSGTTSISRLMPSRACVKQAVDWMRWLG